MKFPTPGAVLRRVKQLLASNPDRFLKQVSGVVHVGANIGGERDVYRQYGLRVIWFEPIPETFETLKKKLNGYEGQQAFNTLVTDRDNAEYQFHISNNGGCSSSILDLKLHKDIWPEVAYDKTITLKSITLTSFFKQEGIRPDDYNALIIDTQGAELLVLKGAEAILNGFKFIKAEAADFEAYAGGCQLRDLELYFSQHGFREISRSKFAERPEGGSYYDLVYQRQS